VIVEQQSQVNTIHLLSYHYPHLKNSVCMRTHYSLKVKEGQAPIPQVKLHNLLLLSYG
jgi:hypothetical protein